jgi:transposase-like protein
MEDMSEMSELMNTSDVAKKLGVQPNTLEKWRLQGEGPPHYRLGRRVLYEIADVTAWLEQRRVGSTSATITPPI